MRSKLTFLLIIAITQLAYCQIQPVANFSNYSSLVGMRVLNNGNILYMAKDTKGNSQLFSTNPNSSITKQLTDPCPSASNQNIFNPNSVYDNMYTDGNYYYGIINKYNNCSNGNGTRVIFKTDGNTLSYSNQDMSTLGLYELGNLSNTFSLNGKPLLIGNNESIYSIDPNTLTLEKIHSVPSSVANRDLSFIGNLDGKLLFSSYNSKNFSIYEPSSKSMQPLINFQAYYQGIYSGFINPEVKEYTIIPDNGYQPNIGFLDGFMYFWVYAYTGGDDLYINALWKTDGTAGGTKEVKRFIKNDQNTSRSVSFVKYNNELYFRFVDSGKAGLWKTNGTEAGTVPVKVIVESLTASFYNIMSNIVILNNQMYFTAKGQNPNYQLWKSDGTEAGTQQAFKIFDSNILDTNNIYSPYIISDGSRLYFFGNSIFENGLISTDGSLENTVNLGISPQSVGYNLSNPVIIANNNLYYPTKNSEKSILNMVNLNTAQPYFLDEVSLNQKTLTIKAKDLSTVSRIYLYENNSDLLTHVTNNIKKINNTTIQYTLDQYDVSYINNRNFKVAVATDSGTYLQKHNQSNNMATLDVNKEKSKVYTTKEFLIIEPDFSIITAKAISVHNMNGQTVSRKVITKNQSLKIPIADFVKGTYIVSIDNEAPIKVLIK